MNIEEKERYIKDYIKTKLINLKEICTSDPGYFISIEKYEKAVNKYTNNEMLSEPLDKIIEMIDLESEQLLESYNKWVLEQKEAFLERLKKDSVENDKMGLTLNRQMIELMMIAKAKDVEEIVNIASTLNIDITDINDVTLDNLKKSVFDKYRNTLTERNLFLSNQQANLEVKLNNIIINSGISSEELETLKSIFDIAKKQKYNSNETFQYINKSFSEDTVHKIFTAYMESRDLSETGILNYDISDYQSIYKKINDFRSITIDYESKYPAVHMANGEFYYQKLDRCLDFAKSLGKDVRLNALIFFDDCPKYISDLEPNEDNKRIAYNELLRYVDETTKHIAEYNQRSLSETGHEVVKSIDMFNELITRFSQDFGGKYFDRGNLPTSNNYEAGWQKFLNINDLCEIALCARKNLPNMEFVFNEINLEDKEKLPIFKDLMGQINDFEIKNSERLNGKKIIDCIGTQMHLNPNTTLEDINYSLQELSSLGLPIKITEYDQPLSNEYIESHTAKECDDEKQRIQETYKQFLINNAQKYNIKQVTIWSLTDSTSFLLDIENKVRIEKSEKPLDTIYSGAFRDKKSSLNKTEKSLEVTNNDYNKVLPKVVNQEKTTQVKRESFDKRSQGEVQIASQIRQKNQLIKQQKSQKKQMDKPKTLVRTKPTSPTTPSSKGFIDIITLSLVVSFIVGAVSMLTYFLISR